MSDALSIQAAAQECPKDIALIVGDAHYSYEELAQRCQEIPLSSPNLYRAEDELTTALRFYRSLQDHKWIALLAKDSTADQYADTLAQLSSFIEEEIALILFTSGSSGQAKGVKLSRRALVASAKASAKRLLWYGRDRWLCALPLSHIGGLSILTRCLVSRKTLILCNGFQTDKVAQSLVEKKATHISLVPTMLWRLLDAGVTAPKQLAVTLIGGAAIAPSLVQRAQNAGFTLQLSYGMTESASQIVTQGRPLEEVQLRLIDDRLEIKAPMLMNGYLCPSDSPAIVDGWFRSSDRALLHDNGSVTILGRADDVIISGGENIALREVEAQLTAHPAVAIAYALGLPHPEWGQELVVLVVLKDPATTLDSLQASFAEGPRHMRPKHIIPVAGLPLLNNGKIDRQKAQSIAEQYRDGIAAE